MHPPRTPPDAPLDPEPLRARVQELEAALLAWAKESSEAEHLYYIETPAVPLVRTTATDRLLQIAHTLLDAERQASGEGDPLTVLQTENAALRAVANNWEAVARNLSMAMEANGLNGIEALQKQCEAHHLTPED